MQDALVFDGHIHMINRQFYRVATSATGFRTARWISPGCAREASTPCCFRLFVTEEYYPPRYETKQTLRLIDLALEQLKRNARTIELAATASDIERISKQGRIAAVLDLEGGFDLDGDLGVLRDLYRLGLRAAQLPAHNWANNFADSCCAPAKWQGLNERGRGVIREMNRLGILINISHASDETMEQAIDISSDPLVATHHGLRSFDNIPWHHVGLCCSRSWRPRRCESGSTSGMSFITEGCLSGGRSRRENRSGIPAPSARKRPPCRLRRSIRPGRAPVSDGWGQSAGRTAHDRR